MNIENKNKAIEGMKSTIREQQDKIERYEKALKEILEEAYEEAGTHLDTGMQLDTFIAKTAKKALEG